MKKTLIVLIILFLFGYTSVCQNGYPSYGKISLEELEMISFEKDPEAEAVVLYDIGKSYFIRTEDGFDVVFERRTRIKILSEAGLEYADISIPYYIKNDDKFEIVRDIMAKTYNYDNGELEITGLERSDIFSEKLNAGYRAKKFALPKVKVGSVIEYSYEIVSPFKFNLQDWSFQHQIPTIFSEYEVRMIPFYEYTWLLIGAKKFDSQKSYVDKRKLRKFYKVDFYDMIHKYTMKDIPAFKDEDYLRSVYDRLIKIDFQIAKVIDTWGQGFDAYSDWPDLIKDFNKHDRIGKYVKKSKGKAKSLIDLERLSAKTSLERLQYIVNYVKSNYSWNGWNNYSIGKGIEDFIDDKIGNSANINLFLAGLLKAANIEAYPVVLSTRSHGKIRYDYPFEHFFNYVIVLAIIDGKEYLIDATEVMTTFDVIPLRCINDKGLVLKKSGVTWKDLESDPKAETKTDIKFAFKDNVKEYTAKVNISTSFYQAFLDRKNYGTDVKYIKENLRNKGYSVIDSSISVTNSFELNKPFRINYGVYQGTEIIMDKIYISPFLNEIIKSNPLNQKTRSYPLDFGYSSLNEYNVEIEIPDNYKIDFVPEDFYFSNDLFEIKYSSNISSNKVDLLFHYNFKKPIYKASEYQRLKYYYNEIIKRSTDKLVLVKNE